MERSRLFLTFVIAGPLLCLIGLAAFTFFLETKSNTEPPRLAGDSSGAITETQSERTENGSANGVDPQPPRSNKNVQDTADQMPTQPIEPIYNENESLSEDADSALSEPPTLDTQEVTVEERFDARFAIESHDPAWSYAEEQRISEAVTPVLEEVNGWIEELQCRETLCRLAVRQSGEASTGGQFFSRVASQLSRASHIPDGGVLILRIDNSDGNPRVHLGIARHEGGLR